MEVHHHPHVGKKKFKEYLLEGLMIFIAVTLGFFAESLREHFVNKETVHQNMENLIANLEEDTMTLAGTIKFCQMKVNWVDSFAALKRAKLPDTSFRKQFVYYALKLSAAQSFISNQTAFEQMKSSGTLRLIRPPYVVDSILKYQSMYEVLKLQGDEVATWYAKNQEQFAQSMDFTELAASNDIISLNMHMDDLRADRLPVVTKDSALLFKFFNYEIEEKSALMNYIYFLNRQLSYGTTLISFLRKEYGLTE